MTKLYAQPYDLAASGFYFETVEEYTAKAEKNRNDYGEIVEEYDIQFIDGDDLDYELAKTWGLYQSNFAAFLEKAEDWEDWQKVNYIIAVGEGCISHDDAVDDPDHIDIDLYECDSLKELAEQFIYEGLFGDIPERLECYIDYEAIARDLSVDYTEITVDNTRYIYRCF